MSTRFTIDVSDEEANLIRKRIEGGDYRSAEEVLRAGLVALTLSDPPDIADDVLRRLIDEADADDGPDIDAAEAFAEIRQHIHDVARRRAKA
jgi:Arc/MetJ-type ribon-helix-helix transcriptional regulator